MRASDSAWGRRVCSCAVVLASCASPGPTEPPPPPQPVTLLVENNSCAAGRCMTLDLRAFIWSFSIPQNPLGFRSIARVPTGVHCVTLPDTMYVRIIGPGVGGVPDTTIIVWRSDDPAGIHLIAVDSAAFYGGPASPEQADSMNSGIYPYTGLGPSIGESARFVPAESEGWRIAFPAVPPHEGELLPVSSCIGSL